MIWSDYFYYDEDSPTCLRWAVDIFTGVHRKILNAEVGSVAGGKDHNGYWRVQLNGKKYLVHRIVWEILNGPILPKIVIDHIDRVRTNNRIDNLRVVSQAVNTRNRVKNKRNKVHRCLSSPEEVYRVDRKLVRLRWSTTKEDLFRKDLWTRSFQTRL